MRNIILLSFLCISFTGAFAQPNPKALAFYRSGIDYRNRNMFPEALFSFKKAVALDKNMDSAWVEIGSLNYRTSKFDSAIYHFKKALGLNPVNTTAWLGLGLVYRDVKPNYDSTIYCCTHILDIDSARKVSSDSIHKLCYYSIAWCYNSKKEYANALNWASKGLDMDHTYGILYNEMAHAIHMGKLYQEGIVRLNKYLAIAEMEKPLLYLGLIYNEMKDKEQAMVYYERLRKLNTRMADNLKKQIDKL